MSQTVRLRLVKKLFRFVWVIHNPCFQYNKTTVSSSICVKPFDLLGSKCSLAVERRKMICSKHL